MRRRWQALERPGPTLLALAVLAIAFTLASRIATAAEDDPAARWERAGRQASKDDAPLTLFVESEPTSGRPAFKIETRFAAPPFVAAAVLMEGMLSGDDLPRGQRRQVLERGEHEALVYTFIDLPFMLSDRELALRIVHSQDPESGTHRVDWSEANEALPESEARVVRLTGAAGYWQFRPDARGGTRATHVTQTELGGAIPDAIGYRLMKSQALESVERLRGRIREQGRSRVAGSAPLVAEPIRE